MRLTLGLLTLLVTAGIVASATAKQDEIGPVYNMDGAWYGIVTLGGFPPIPSLDNITANHQKQGLEGSLLCTIPAMRLQHPDHLGDPLYWLTVTPSGHGTWVRTGTNQIAYTAVRSMVDQNGMYFGRVFNWGTFTPVSQNEFTGTMTLQSYRADGTPFGRRASGTAHSTRLGIIPED